MKKELKVEKSIDINSSAEKIWRVMTESEFIKQYLYGTEASGAWEEGEQIFFRGAFDGMSYEDKGWVKRSEKPHLLSYSYWSSFSGLEDHPDNYFLVTYKIDSTDEGCRFTWHQEGFPNEERQKHTENSLGQILEQIKSLAEKL